MSAEARDLTPQELEVKEHHRNRISSWQDLLHRLRKNEVGRGIVIDTFGRNELIGYILPINVSDDSHLIIFRDGFMAVTEADREVEETAAIYRSRTRRSVGDYVVGEERPSDILRELVLHPGGKGARELGRVILTNDSPETASEFEARAEIALELARRNITERKRVVIETTEAVSNVLDSMLGQGILS